MEILQLCGFWNGVCKSTYCIMERVHHRFECGNLVDFVEETNSEEVVGDIRKKFGAVMMMGTCLAFLGDLVAARTLL